MEIPDLVRVLIVQLRYAVRKSPCGIYGNIPTGV